MADVTPPTRWGDADRGVKPSTPLTKTPRSFNKIIVAILFTQWSHLRSPSYAEQYRYIDGTGSCSRHKVKCYIQKVNKQENSNVLSDISVELEYAQSFTTHHTCVDSIGPFCRFRPLHVLGLDCMVGCGTILRDKRKAPAIFDCCFFFLAGDFRYYTISTKITCGS